MHFLLVFSMECWWSDNMAVDVADGGMDILSALVAAAGTASPASEDEEDAYSYYDLSASQRRAVLR